MKRAIFVAMLAIGLLAIPTAAHAQYGSAQGFLIDPAEGYPGDRVNLLGTGCGSLTIVRFFVRETGQEIASTTTNADSDGSFFVAGVAIPDLPPGVYTVEARCGFAVGGLVLTARLTVLERVQAGAGVGAGAAGVGRSPGNLAFTGNREPRPWVKAGLVLIAAGAIVVLVVRRKKEDPAPVS